MKTRRFDIGFLNARRPGVFSHGSRSLRQFLQFLRNRRPYLFTRHLKYALRQARRLEAPVVSVAAPRSSGRKVLISYHLKPFFLRPEDPHWFSHSFCLHTVEMVRTFVEMGYDVDVIDYKDPHFRPWKEYSVFIDVATNMERIAPYLSADCLKIFYITTCHWLYFHKAQLERLSDLQRRRGAVLLPRRLIHPNRGIEVADCAVGMGNDFSFGTYAFAGKPMFRLPNSAVRRFSSPEGKDFSACRRNFLWLGSKGLVHKGLDLVLEAFAGMPDYHLTVCGPISNEEDFEKEYFRELYETPNIHTVGWVNVDGPEFAEILDRTLGLVYPSSSESMAGCVLNSISAGLLPIITEACSVDTEDFGFVLDDVSVETIRREVIRLSSKPTDELRRLSVKAWSFARARYTAERFSTEYGDTVRRILSSFNLPCERLYQEIPSLVTVDDSAVS